MTAEQRSDALAPSTALAACWQELGISEQLLLERRLELFQEPGSLTLAETGSDGREHLLEREAAQAWATMKQHARSDAVEMHIVSAFRSIERQTEIIAHKLRAGLSLEAILAVSAPPGCSEHHTGRAVDIGTHDVVPLEPEFEHTVAFGWLVANAGRHGFRMSYPRGNPQGYDYEPWHWCFVRSTVSLDAE